MLKEVPKAVLAGCQQSAARHMGTHTMTVAVYLNYSPKYCTYFRVLNGDLHLGEFF